MKEVYRKKAARKNASRETLNILAEKRNKTNKTVLILSASALFALGSAFTAAAAGWQQDGENWYYYDTSGSAVTNEWKTSGNNQFYLGDDGAMQKDSLISDGDNYYYVNADGAMVTNQWLLCDPSLIGEDSSEQVYMYFGSNGRAYKLSSGSSDGFAKKIIDGKTYAFNENGRMLTGFVTEDGEMLEEDTEDPFMEAMYYFGEADDGAMLVNSWLSYTAGSEAESNVSGISYEDYETLYFYFGSSGKKTAPSSGNETTEKTINGQKYIFDENGVMLSSWVGTASGSTAIASASSVKYFSNALDGHLQKNTWIYAVPDEEMDEEDYNDDQPRWFYSGSTGTVTKNQIKKINGKRYLFDENGIMKSGLLVADDSGSLIGTIDWEETTGEDILTGSQAALISQGNLYYFSNDEEKDGSMKTGKTIQIELSDDTYTFGFNSNGKAYGVNGVELVSNKYYQNGILLKAESDVKYGVVQDADGKLIVVNTSGTKQTGSKLLKDGNDGYLIVKNGEYFAYDTTGEKPVSANNTYYEYDDSASNHRGSEIEQDTDGSQLSEDLKLNF